MGNPTVFYPGDEPTPCWSCKHFLGLGTQPVTSAVMNNTVTCAERGRFLFIDPDEGCRAFEPLPCADGES
jgi:hypothetical protein